VQGLVWAQAQGPAQVRAQGLELALVWAQGPARVRAQGLELALV